MSRKRIAEAMEILTALGVPRAQQNERSALTLLALANVGRDESWKDAQRPMLRILDIMEFMRRQYRKKYAPNTRETVRRQTIHQFEQARIVDRNPDDPTRPTNSGKNVYRLTNGAHAVVRLYGSRGFKKAVAEFIEQYGSLQAAYQSSRAANRVPLRMPDGQTVYLSPGKHNELQVAVIEEFGPRFAPRAEVLYVGDTAFKHVVCDAKGLSELGVVFTEHDKLPDIVLYWRERNWLFLIEAVTSHGPVSPKRHHELEQTMKGCPAGRVYVSAFPNAATFRRYAADIAWETEVWIAETPDHMIHFNGPKFLGPYV